MGKEKEKGFLASWVGGVFGLAGCERVRDRVGRRTTRPTSGETAGDGAMAWAHMLGRGGLEIGRAHV